MPPRKPKQPARKKAEPRKATKKTASKAAKKATPDYDPKTHILADDGKVYERKVVSGTGVSAGVGGTAKSDAYLELERKMSHAILKAHSEGVSDPEEIKRRILAAREDHLNNG
jgi:histidine ammonia-lyase